MKTAERDLLNRLRALIESLRRMIDEALENPKFRDCWPQAIKAQSELDQFINELEFEEKAS